MIKVTVQQVNKLLETKPYIHAFIQYNCDEPVYYQMLKLGGCNRYDNGIFIEHYSLLQLENIWLLS